MLYAVLAFISNVIEQILIKHTLGHIDLLTFAFIFYSCSTLFTFLYHFRRRDAGANQRFDIQKALEHKLLLSCYIGASFVANAMWFVCIMTIGLGMTSFILVFIRILVTAYSYFFMDDHLPTNKIIAFVVGFVALLVFSFTGDDVPLWGVLLAFTACFGFAAEQIFFKKLSLHKAKGENITLLRNFSVMVLWGAIFLGNMLFNPEAIETISMLSGALTVELILIIAMTSCFGGVMMYLFAFKALETVKLSAFESLNAMKPPIVALIGVLLLGETLTTIQIMAGAIIIASSLYFLNVKGAKA